MAATALTTNFCPDCGSLLDVPAFVDFATCSLCQYSCPSSDFERTTIITRSTNPDHLTLPDDGQIKSGPKDQHATINEECLKCHAKQVTFHTMQLRSADEGQTVFYHCLKCGHKWNVNT